jgi:hypothetical protein
MLSVIKNTSKTNYILHKIVLREPTLNIDPFESNVQIECSMCSCHSDRRVCSNKYILAGIIHVTLNVFLRFFFMSSLNMKYVYNI